MTFPYKAFVKLLAVLTLSSGLQSSPLAASASFADLIASYNSQGVSDLDGSQGCLIDSISIKSGIPASLEMELLWEELTDIDLSSPLKSYVLERHTAIPLFSCNSIGDKLWQKVWQHMDDPTDAKFAVWREDVDCLSCRYEHDITILLWFPRSEKAVIVRASEFADAY